MHLPLPRRLPFRCQPSQPRANPSRSGLWSTHHHRATATSALSPTALASISVTSASDEVDIDEPLPTLPFAPCFHSFGEDPELGQDLPEAVELSSVNIRVRGSSCTHIRHGLRTCMWEGSDQTRRHTQTMSLPHQMKSISMGPPVRTVLPFIGGVF